MGDNK